MMNRSVERARITATTPVVAGEILVATHLRHPLRGAVRCLAAPLVAGSLRRRGFVVRYGEISSRFTRPGGHTELRFTSWLNRDGQALGFGAAANAGDAAAKAALTEVMREWSSVLRTRRLLLAGTQAACWGARRAAEAVRRVLARKSPVYLYGPMVAEAHTIAKLRHDGALVVSDLAQVPDGGTVVFPAHGVSPEVNATANARGLSTVDATCPLVALSHAEIHRSVRRGDAVVVIGRIGHAVLEALRGQAPENVHFVQNVADVHRMTITDPDRLSYLVAPGYPVDEATGVIAALRENYPTVRAQHPDGLCYESTDRSEVIKGVARACEVLLVAGEHDCADAQSVAAEARANSRAEVHIVARVEDVQPLWLTAVGSVGMTGSLSTAPGEVERITTAVSGLGPLSTVRREINTFVTAPHSDGIDPPVRSNAVDSSNFAWSDTTYIEAVH